MSVLLSNPNPTDISLTSVGYDRFHFTEIFCKLVMSAIALIYANKLFQNRNTSFRVSRMLGAQTWTFLKSIWTQVIRKLETVLFEWEQIAEQ